MRASPIRDLARRHATGELSQEDYRAKRHALIDDIVSGQQTLAYDERHVVATPSPRSARLLLLSGAAIAVVIVVAIIIWLIGTRPSRSISSVQPTSAAARPNAAQLSPGPQLIQDFLHKNDWSRNATQNFIQQWNSLPRVEQEIAKKYYRYPRLVSDLRQQIVSQQAMSGLTSNADGAKAQLASLQNMAGVLGMESDN